MIYQDKLITGFTSLNIFNKNSGMLCNYLIQREIFKEGLKSGVAMIKKGIVYVTTGNPRPGSYGVNRPGGNENSCS